MHKRFPLSRHGGSEQSSKAGPAQVRDKSPDDDNDDCDNNYDSTDGNFEDNDEQITQNMTGLSKAARLVQLRWETQKYLEMLDNKISLQEKALRLLKEPSTRLLPF